MLDGAGRNEHGLNVELIHRILQSVGRLGLRETPAGEQVSGANAPSERRRTRPG